ncbi:MAG TPA: hypothetical protein VL737_04865 [Candidatus Pristimantibacillus sp.]|jgi:hypothetical protein|nr:hypothetical protein [Candidatus Pristimantibacillus sp.]
MTVEGVNVPHEVIALEEPRISWVNATQEELAFVPPMTNEELDEARAVLAEDAAIIEVEEAQARTSRGVEAATVLAVRATAKVTGSFPEQMRRLPGANEAALQAAVEALTVWWTSKNSEAQS